MKIMTPMGCLIGLGVISPQGLVGGSYPYGCFKMLKWLSALIFVFNFFNMFSRPSMGQSRFTGMKQEMACFSPTVCNSSGTSRCQSCG